MVLLHVYFFIVLPQIHPFDFGEDPINSGESLSLTCSISKGDMPVTINWLFNNQTIDLDAGVSIIKVNKKNSMLNIDSVQAHNIGEYACTATNKAGTSRYSTYLHVNGTILICLKLLCSTQFFPKSFPLTLVTKISTLAI